MQKSAKIMTDKIINNNITVPTRLRIVELMWNLYLCNLYLYNLYLYNETNKHLV